MRMQQNRLLITILTHKSLHWAATHVDRFVLAKVSYMTLFLWLSLKLENLSL